MAYRLALWFSLAAAPALAQELSLEEVARLQAERDKAVALVAKRFGDRPPGELSNLERRQQIAEEQQAIQQLLQKEGVDGKALSLREMRLTSEEQAAVNAARAALAAQDQAQERLRAERARQEQGVPEGEPEIVFGPSEDAPMEVYREPGAVVIERLDPDAEAGPGGDQSSVEPVIERGQGAPTDDTSLLPEAEPTRAP